MEGVRRRSDRHSLSLWLLVGFLVLVVSACSGDIGPGLVGEPIAGEAQKRDPDLVERLALIDEAVVAWGNADSIEDAHLHAETAANLIVGSNGPDYGDRDGDGGISGSAVEGLLPGFDGTPVGIANMSASNACIERDVLGGSWENPEARWESMVAAIDAWEPGNNTMPTLASHLMRVVGWATFTIDTGSLDEAHIFAGHADIHSSLSVRAVDC